jgi:prepilin-type N-terminal cleavage/methylation domain-containing protein
MKKNKGFTLIETMVALGMIVLISVAVATFQTNIFRFNKYTKDVIESAQDSRAIIATIVKEMRSMSPSGNGAYPISSVATSTVTFFSDIDGDTKMEQVRYFLTGNVLKKGVIASTGNPPVYNPASEVITTLAYNLKNSSTTPLFEYYDTNYAGTSSPLTYPVNITSIRLIRTNLLIDADPNRSPIPRLYTSTATLRNLKDNL